MHKMTLTPVALLIGSLALSTAQAAPDGKTIAMKGQGGVPCQSCHGMNGEGNAAGGFPRLAGMNAEYLERQLHAFKDGGRQNPVMAPQAASLDDAAIKAVAEYYAKLPAPAGQAATPDPKLMAEGKALAQQGRWSDTIPACESCHGPQGQGLAPHFPALSGQHASYIASQLKAWQNGQRSNDPNGLMAGVAKRLTDEDIKAVSAFFASLPAPAQANQK